MEPNIHITEIENGLYEVIVDEGVDNESRHLVRIDDAYLEELGVDAGTQEAIENLLRRTFHFLLKREPKERILPEFELPLVERYFPEYRATVRKMGDTE